jgi:hypothetical protein
MHATNLRLLPALLFFSLGVATGLLAQTSSDSAQRVEQKRTDLSGAPGMEVIASTAEYKPGDSLEPTRLTRRPATAPRAVVGAGYLGSLGLGDNAHGANHSGVHKVSRTPQHHRRTEVSAYIQSSSQGRRLGVCLRHRPV